MFFSQKINGAGELRRSGQVPNRLSASTSSSQTSGRVAGGNRQSVAADCAAMAAHVLSALREQLAEIRAAVDEGLRSNASANVMASKALGAGASRTCLFFLIFFLTFPLSFPCTCVVFFVNETVKAVCPHLRCRPNRTGAYRPDATGNAFTRVAGGPGQSGVRLHSAPYTPFISYLI